MIQLIINGIYLPQTSNDKYSSRPKQLGEQIEMISGRIVTEVRGTVQIITYSYDKMPDDTYRALLAALRSETAIPVAYLPDDSDTLATGNFICTEKPTPTFAFAKNGGAVWHNVTFTLREVRPHD